MIPIQDSERPICQTCGTPLEWNKTVLGNSEFCGWDMACDCVDVYRIKPDNVEEFLK